MNKNEKIVAVPQVFLPKDGSRPRSLSVDLVRASAIDKDGKYEDFVTSIQVALIQTESGLLVIKRLSDLVQRIIHFTNQSQRDVYVLLEGVLDTINQPDQLEQSSSRSNLSMYPRLMGEPASD